jgi:hypothetical protein
MTEWNLEVRMAIAGEDGKGSFNENCDDETDGKEGTKYH